MSTAIEKILQAMQRVGIEPVLMERLSRVRIGVYSDSASNRPAGRLVAEALGDVTGRLWRRMDAVGPLAATFVAAANEAALSGRQEPPAAPAWAPPYDFVVALGVPVPEGVGPGIQVGADGWEARFGPNGDLSDDPNPVGPAAAAGLTAAELFRVVFADSLDGRAKHLPQNYRWSAWDHGRGQRGPSPMNLVLDRMAFFGVGAVTHGLLWPLARWPAAVTGAADLVDPDQYAESNGQRYAGMRSSDIDKFKVEQVANRLHQRHRALQVRGLAMNANEYFAAERPDRSVSLAVVGLDSKEQRRQLALKLPKRIINMWTDGEVLGAARHGIGDGWPCLYCRYPEDESGALDEVGQIHQETGIQPVRVRHLLQTNAPLQADDLALISQRYGGIDVAALAGRPLRTVRAELCAMGRIRLPGVAADVDAPLAFVSLLAGIAGFVELVRELCGTGDRPGSWQLPAFKPPLEGNWVWASPNETCYLCGDELARRLVRERYG